MRGPAVFEAGAIPPPEGVDEMSRVRPAEQGLYAAEYEHDACGVAFVARLDAQPLHETVRRALAALANLEHRGAAGADPSTGDGAGILMQIPDAFFRAVVAEELPAAGPLRRRDVLPPARGRAPAASSSSCSTAIVEDEGQSVVCWRDVPVDPAFAGRTAAAAAPLVRQLVVAASDAPRDDQDAFERKLYVIRRRFELEGGADAIVPSFSSRTIVYKGMLTAPQLRGYYPDLQDERTETRARARPLAVLDQHVPELGARPPVPDDRPQRRDQHRAREHQLDARARVAARVRAVRRRPPQGAAARPGGRLRLGRRSTTCSSCSCSAAARCRTR